MAVSVEVKYTSSKFLFVCFLIKKPCSPTKRLDTMAFIINSKISVNLYWLLWGQKMLIDGICLKQKEVMVCLFI